MRIYRVFAYLIALEVFVQAASHAYGAAGLGHWICSDGHTVTKATWRRTAASTFTGRWAESCTVRTAPCSCRCWRSPSWWWP